MSRSVRRLMHRVSGPCSGWLAVAAIVVPLSFVRAQERRVALPIQGDPAPAFEADPRAPGPDRKGEILSPQAARIERDACVGDRFLAEGQRVLYDFDADAGELSLFELNTYGYERGWQSEAELSVLDLDGKVLAVRRVAGGTVYRVFLEFAAPAAGPYRVELVAHAQYFRYTLVRHSRFHAHEEGALYALENRTKLYDHLAHGEDIIRYEFVVRAGEAIGLRVLPSSDASRRVGRLERRASIHGAETNMAQDAMRSMDGMRQGGDAPWLPELEALVDGKPIGPLGHYLAFVADHDGPVEIRVRSRAAGEGGIFELATERSLPRYQVRGSVSDRDGEARAGMLVDFFREPEFDLVESARSGPDGAYDSAVPAGDYTIRVRSPEGDTLSCVQAKIEADRELHVIAGGAR